MKLFVIPRNWIDLFELLFLSKTQIYSISDDKK